MSHVPHELAEEFPDHGDVIRALRMKDAHFAKLADEYHEVNRILHRVETNVEPMADTEALRLRKTRMALKDEVARMIGAFDAA